MTPGPRRGTRVLALALSLLAPAASPRPAVAAPTRATVTGAPADVGLLRASAARYRGLERYELRGRLEMRIVSGAPEQTLMAPFVVAYTRPGRLRDEFRNPAGGTLQVSDGTARYEYVDQLHQYRRHPHPVSDDAVAAGSAGGPFAFGIALVRMFGAMADSALTVKRLADDSVAVDGVTRPCIVLEVGYPKPTPAAGVSAEGARTYWIDREDHRLLRVRSRLTRSGEQGPVVVEQVTAFDRVRLGEPVADSVFAFTPPEGARAVRQWQFPGQGGGPDLTGEPAHDFELSDLDGHRHRLSDHKGSVVLLDFWATWCGPCRITMPLVDKLDRELRARGLVVYSVNLRESGDRAREYLRKTGYGMVTLLDEKGAVGDAYHVNGIPALFVIGKDGKVASQMVGVQSEEDLREALEDAGIR